MSSKLSPQSNGGSGGARHSHIPALRPRSPRAGGRRSNRGGLQLQPSPSPQPPSSRPESTTPASEPDSAPVFDESPSESERLPLPPLLAVPPPVVVHDSESAFVSSPEDSPGPPNPTPNPSPGESLGSHQLVDFMSGFGFSQPQKEQGTKVDADQGDDGRQRSLSDSSGSGPFVEEDVTHDEVKQLLHADSNGDSELELLLPPADEDATVDLLFRKQLSSACAETESTPSLYVQHKAKAELTTKASSTEEHKLEGVEEFIPVRRTSMLTSEEEKKAINEATATTTAQQMKPNPVPEPPKRAPQAPPEGDEDEMEVISKDTVDRERLLKKVGAVAGLVAVVAAGGFVVYWLVCKRRGG